MQSVSQSEPQMNKLRELQQSNLQDSKNGINKIILRLHGHTEPRQRGTGSAQLAKNGSVNASVLEPRRAVPSQASSLDQCELARHSAAWHRCVNDSEPEPCRVNGLSMRIGIKTPRVMCVFDQPCRGLKMKCSSCWTYGATPTSKHSWKDAKETREFMRRYRKKWRLLVTKEPLFNVETKSRSCVLNTSVSKIITV